MSEKELELTLITYLELKEKEKADINEKKTITTLEKDIKKYADKLLISIN